MFSLAEAKLMGSRALAEVYEEIRSKARFALVDLEQFNTPTFLDFPKLHSGFDSTKALAGALGMKPYNISGTRDEKYKKYGFKISGYLHRDGNFKVTDLELFSDLPKGRIQDFFTQNRFDIAQLPIPVDRWLIAGEYFFVRKADDTLARKERQQEIHEERENLRKLLVADSIAGRYIPKDLADSFRQLDKELSTVDRNEMATLPERKAMITYHRGLGMWMRNNWGLWGGSRLQKYFTDKGISHPDGMSSVILFYYWDWLRGNKEGWKDWEKDPKQTIF